MALDGVIRRVAGDCYLPMDVPTSTEHRAIALGLAFPARLQDRLIIGRLSAAWVYTGQHLPPRITALIDHRRRSGALPPFSALHIHEVTLGSHDIRRISGVRVTTPLRTAVDLAFMLPSTVGGWPDPEAVLWELCRQPGLRCPLPLVREAVAALSRAPHRLRALNRVDRLLDLLALRQSA